MAAARTLLLTGFEPFGGDDFNPSGTLARSLSGQVLPGGVVIESLTLPVSGPPAWRKLSREIRRTAPHWIVATGVSGRAEISVETTAWNEDDFRIADNAGRQPRGSLILPRGPARLTTGLSLSSCLTGNNPDRLPVFSSTDPGRYVCNHLYYRLLHLTQNPAHSAHRRALFLHLPCTPEMQRGPADDRFFHPLKEIQAVVLTILAMIRDPNMQLISQRVKISGQASLKK